MTTRTTIFGEEQPKRIWLTCERHGDILWIGDWPEEDSEDHEAVEYVRADLAMHSSRPVVEEGRKADYTETERDLLVELEEAGNVLDAGGHYDLRDAVREATTQASELVALKGEIETLRQIVSDCATALGNGSVIQPTSSIEFMGYLPNEIRLHVASLKAKDHSGGGE